jgi:hypothetical protein
MPVSRGLVNACEPEVSADVVVLTNWLIGWRRVRSCNRIRLQLERGPSVFCCLPHLSEIRNNVRLALRARMFHAQQIASYPMGGNCMLTDLLFRVANKFRFYAPSTVMTLAYIVVI